MNALLIFFVTGIVCVVEGRSPYIINGSVSSKGRWPWQVSVQWYQPPLIKKSSHTCGGSVINNRWIVLAAHCVIYDKNPDNYLVKLGLFRLKDDDFEQELRVKRIVDHPRFDPFDPYMKHDICLLELDGEVELHNPHVDSVALADGSESFVDNHECWISGWGKDDRNSNDPSNELKESRVPVLTNDDCRNRYLATYLVKPPTEWNVCAGDPTTEDVHICHGDSGGPLVCSRDGRFELVGVSSRTGSVDCSDRPSVFTRVSKYLDWIHTVMDM